MNEWHLILIINLLLPFRYGKSSTILELWNFIQFVDLTDFNEKNLSLRMIIAI